jgi:hypothetical protein
MYGTLGAVDQAGRFLTVTLTGSTVDGLAAVTPTDRPYALFGIAMLEESGLMLRTLSMVGATSGSASQAAAGRIYPE